MMSPIEVRETFHWWHRQQTGSSSYEGEGNNNIIREWLTPSLARTLFRQENMTTRLYNMHKPYAKLRHT